MYFPTRKAWRAIKHVDDSESIRWCRQWKCDIIVLKEKESRKITADQHRHDINDKAWEKISPHTIGENGTRGGNARDTRQFINGVFWILRAGAPWRDLPKTYGNWKNVHRRFCRWLCYGDGNHSRGGDDFYPSVDGSSTSSGSSPVWAAGRSILQSQTVDRATILHLESVELWAVFATGSSASSAAGSTAQGNYKGAAVTL